MVVVSLPVAAAGGDNHLSGVPYDLTSNTKNAPICTMNARERRRTRAFTLTETHAGIVRRNPRRNTQ